MKTILWAGACLLLLGCQSHLDHHTQYHKGWPDTAVSLSQLRESFVSPPVGYGNVPFYWWDGDSLDQQRLGEQLDLLADAPIDGLSVSYIHTHPGVDIEANAHGYGSFGKTDVGNPPVFSEAWWQLWNDYSAACARRGIGLGLDDYVVGWAGNGHYVDEVLQSDGFRDFQGRLVMVRKDTATVVPTDHVVTQNDSCWICTRPSPELHPDYGKRLIEVYFSRFEQRMDPSGREGMNYFFQDELQYALNLHSWCPDMPQQFRQIKGYDIVPHLPRLFANAVDTQTARIRLDYSDVVTRLAEERYFSPIYQWHNERGLIYGCDNVGRGLDPLSYLDYYRITSWFTAPGNDAPARGSSFRQTKVSSSIAHLYQRPRTWLEAFHSMGWDSNGEWMTRQLDHHLIAGGNLLCMHGLYYSTHGGWWEWAPPCFHFRMPYWPHMKEWLRYAQRMCYVLSQGTHVCDVAVLYPTEAMQAYPDIRPDAMFALTDSLSAHGIDYDYVDFASLQQAVIQDSTLLMGTEQYRVLIVPEQRMLHQATQRQIEAFAEAGGCVITDMGSAIEAISHAIATPDFACSAGYGKVLHRRIDDADIYMVMDVKQGDTLTLRATGRAELWDAKHGTISPLPVAQAGTNITRLVVPEMTGSSLLLTLSPGQPALSRGQAEEWVRGETIDIGGEWTTDIVPTMNNRWGDFRLPASDEMIGVEVREVNGQHYGYGPYFEVQSETDSWQPYRFSWQWGVKDSPGSQGYHGLKGKIDHRFLILDRGGRMAFRTRVLAPTDDIYDIEVDGVEPDVIAIDNQPLALRQVSLSAGWHSLLITYNHTRRQPYSLESMQGDTRDRRDRSSILLYSHDQTHRTLRNHLIYNPIGGHHETERLHFSTAPGTTAMDIKIAGQLKGISIDGTELTGASLQQQGDFWHVTMPAVNTHVAEVTLDVVPADSTPAEACLLEPIRLTCHEGRMPAGDWSLQGAMKYYSGGVRYNQTIRLEHIAAKTVLDLGDVDATCEVWVNGKRVDVLLNPPYRLDVTYYLQQGDNQLSVLVYSSLANHYQSIPSPYRGQPHAGLIGPVRMETYNRESTTNNK